MKNIHWKNIITGVAALVLVATIAFSGTTTIAQIGSGFNPLTQTGNRTQTNLLDIPALQLAPKTTNGAVRHVGPLVTSFFGVTNQATFRQYGTAIFDNIAVYGDTVIDRLNAGFPTIVLEDPDSAQLKVNGAIKIESLGAVGDPYDPYLGGLRLACSNDVGVIEACGDMIDVVSSTAVDGLCRVHTGSHTTQPATDNASGCQTGTFVDVPEGLSDTVYRWSCQGIDGGATVSCTADQTLSLDEVGLGAQSSLPINLINRAMAWIQVPQAHAASSICSERDSLNNNGVYYKSGSAFIRYADDLSFVTNGKTTQFDYDRLRKLGLYSTKNLVVYADKKHDKLLPDGEYLLSGDSVINEIRDPLQNDDGINVPTGTPVSAIAMVVSKGIYSFQVCEETSYLNHDQIREKDMQLIQELLEKYYLKNGRYPKVSGAIEPNGAWTNSSAASWQQLAKTLEVKSLPIDPVNDPENKKTSWTSVDKRYHLFIDETSNSCNNPGQNYILTANFDDEKIVSPGAPTCHGGRNYMKKTVGECKDPVCNASWFVGSFGVCQPDGTQTRTVECRGSDGQKTRVENACATQDGKKPANSQSCTYTTNDQQREQDIQDIKDLLETYYLKNGQYPSSGGSIEPNSGWENSGSPEWDKLAATLGVKSLPVDPINETDGPTGGWNNEYRYYYYSNSYGCGGQWYMLYHKSEDNPSQTVGNVRACSRDFTYGSVIGTGECKSEFCNATWQTSAWGKCDLSGNQTRTVQCVGSKGTPTVDSNCWDAGKKPVTSQKCDVNAGCTSYTSNYTSQPATSTSNGCTAGTYQDTGDTTTQFNWQCNGLNGGITALCSANRQQNGVCGSQNEGTYSATPAISCGLGAKAVWTDQTAADGTWNWTCAGINGGTTATCSANYQRAASCKSYTASYASQPATSTANGCNVGTYLDTADITSSWQWTCRGQNGGADATCVAKRTTYSWSSGKWGICDSKGNQTRTVTCQSSTGSIVADSYCTTTKPVTSQKCAVNASCEVYSGSYTSQPVFGYGSSGTIGNGCTAGTYQDTGDTTTQFNWQCNGLNGGITALCSANRQQNGVCKSYTSNYTSQPATSTASGCTLGNYANISNTSTAFRWTCSGINGGATTTCSAQPQYSWSSGKWGICDSKGNQTRTVTCQSSTGSIVADSYCTTTKPVTSQKCAVNGGCQEFTSEYTSQPATSTSTGCKSGTYLDTPDSLGSFNWQCNGLNGGLSAVCSAKQKQTLVAGKCIIHSGEYISQPAYDNKTGCESGTYIDISDTLDNWQWSCRGSSGKDPICVAKKSSKGGGDIIKDSCDPKASCCYLDSKNNWVPGPPCL